MARGENVAHVVRRRKLNNSGAGGGGIGARFHFAEE